MLNINKNKIDIESLRDNKLENNRILLKLDIASSLTKIETNETDIASNLKDIKHILIQNFKKSRNTLYIYLILTFTIDNFSTSRY